MTRGLVLSIVKKSCKKIVARCTIGMLTVIAMLLKKLPLNKIFKYNLISHFQHNDDAICSSRFKINAKTKCVSPFNKPFIFMAF